MASRLIFLIINWLILLVLDEASIYCFVFQVFLSLESTPDSVFQTDAVKYALVGLMRDLRGIVMATNRLVLVLFLSFKLRKAIKLTYLFFLAAELMAFYLIGCILYACASTLRRHLALERHPRGNGPHL